MNFLKNLFKEPNKPIKSNEEFWAWFQKNERTFFKVIKEQGDIEKQFFDIISPKLNELKPGYFYLTGMFDDNTAELILTADGVVKNIFFVEELINSAPYIDGWKFTALKPALDIKNVKIDMGGYSFDDKNISFYSNDDKNCPDNIDITVVHNALNDANKAVITNGVFIFLDNFLGELNLVTTIDDIQVVGKNEVVKEFIPIEKLKDFLIWREKEFVEKYDVVTYDAENSTGSILEAKLESGNALIAAINTDLLNWVNKASHPWILDVEIKYDGSRNNGMPNNDTSILLNTIQDEIAEIFMDTDGYLNIGRQTAEGIRDIYFACKEFRKPSAVLDHIQKKYAAKIELGYDIYKDKYWQSFNRFR